MPFHQLSHIFSLHEVVRNHSKKEKNKLTTKSFQQKKVVRKR